MKEILLTSSVLILALLALRRVFRRTVSRRVQYALWGLVLLRLLIPVSLPAAGFSLLTAAEPAVKNLQMVYALPDREMIVVPEDAGQNYPYETPPEAVLGPPSPDDTQNFTDRYGTIHATRYKRQFTLSDLLSPVWLGGMTAMACWLAYSNLTFWRKLRERRLPFELDGCRYPVYLVPEGLPSPCLFGLFRPAIYLTPAAVTSPERLRHVLAHEETHRRHLDPLWSLLRGVCLTVYWFDPLVWWAALASRTDCELACDEGALRRLGADQRIPYGQTLLSLVPVRKAPVNPLLSATTMTAGKRQLKDRITRIAENRKNWGIALFAVVSLTAIVCAVTFTGAKSPEPATLSEEEIAWFNEEFFNGEDVNMRNMFLSSLYDSPQQIDLYQLFYCGAGGPMEFTEADRAFLEANGKNDLPLENEELLRMRCSKILLSDIEAVIAENTSITAEEADWSQLKEHFLWSEETGAYYNVRTPHALTEEGMLMDKTHRMYTRVQITSGERNGDLVRLYYTGEVYSGEYDCDRLPLCVTLRQIKDKYYFVSNQPWDTPVVTIPLEDLQPKDLQPVKLLTGPFDGLRYFGGTDWEQAETNILDPYCLLFLTDGHYIYAGVQNKVLSSLPQPFLRLYSEEFSVEGFQDILGHPGFSINYTNSNNQPIRDYYFLTEDGKPVLLARCGQDAQLIDLDGDGERELVSCSVMGGNQKYSQLLFRRDGQIYEADIRALVESAWKDAEAISFDGWDPVNRCLGLSAFAPYDTSDGPTELEGARRVVCRALFYDGANLLLTEDPRSPSEDMGHLMGRSDAPAEVIDAARDLAESAFNQRQSEGFDDWQISTLAGPFEEITGGKRFEIWQMYYELHTPSPEGLSGSAHLSESTWTAPRRPSYLIFQTDRDGNRTLFTTFLESDSAPGTDSFRTGLLGVLVKADSQTFLNIEGSLLAEMFRNQPGQLMKDITGLPEINQEMTIERLANGISSWSQPEWENACLRMENIPLEEKSLLNWNTLEAMVDERMGDPKNPIEALDRMMKESAISMTLLTPDTGPQYNIDPQAGNGPNRALYFPNSFDWQLVEDVPYLRNVPMTLTLTDQNKDFSLYFYEGVNLVLLHTRHQDKWFAAMPKDNPNDVFYQDVFQFMRVWYDEAEYSGLTADIRVPDMGQSQEAIAKAWVDAYEGAKTKATPGSEIACTYVRNEEIEIERFDELSPEELDSFYPAHTAGHERFGFQYKTVFVPENDRARSCLMAGNTGDYEGDDAPEGALEYTRRGYMYKTGDYWRCDEIGTGW